MVKRENHPSTGTRLDWPPHITAPTKTKAPPRAQLHRAQPHQQYIHQGNVTVLGRESPFALYSADLASMEIEGGGAAFDYNPYDAQVRLSERSGGLLEC